MCTAHVNTDKRQRRDLLREDGLMCNVANKAAGPDRKEPVDNTTLHNGSVAWYLWLLQHDIKNDYSLLPV